MGIRGGRSMCVSCQKKLHWYENVPLASYVALHGKCLVCKAQIPFDYFLVELITPILFIWLSIYHLRFPVFNSGHMLRDVIFVILLIIIFVYDAKYQMILSGVVWAGAAIGLAFNFFVLQYSFFSLLIGVVVGGGFFLLQYLISKGRWVGGGDVRLGTMMGLWLGWPNVLAALFVAYVVGAISAIPLLVFKKKEMRSEIPFGTFLAVGTVVAMFWGNFLINWYGGLVGW